MCHLACPRINTESSQYTFELKTFVKLAYWIQFTVGFIAPIAAAGVGIYFKKSLGSTYF